MEHNLIKIENYLLVVSDDEIKEGDIFYRNNDVVDCTYVKVKPKDSDKKIIAHLPLNNSPILQGVDLLPPLEQEIILTDSQQELLKIGDVTYSDTCTTYYIPYSFINKDGKWYINKTAKEKYKFTEEQARQIWKAGQEYWKTSGDSITYEELTERLQSLSQPKLPVEFKCELDLLGMQVSENEKIKVSWIPIPGVDYTPKIKTTTNSQGQTVWVGEYIY